MNCSIGVPGHKSVEDQESGVAEFFLLETLESFRSPKLNCTITSYHPSGSRKFSHETGFFPGNSMHGMLQRGYFDVLAGLPTRLDSDGNTDAFKMEIPLLSSKMIVASSHIKETIVHRSLLQRISPFDFVSCWYMIIISIIIAVVITASHSINSLSKSKRKSFLVSKISTREIKMFMQNLTQIQQQAILRHTIKKPNPRNFPERVVWCSVWLALLVLSYGYVSGLFSTDLNFKIKPPRVESLRDIIKPKFNATPVVYEQFRLAINDFVNAKPGSLEYEIYTVMKKRGSIVFIPETLSQLEAVTLMQTILKLYGDPTKVIVEYDHFMSLIMRGFDLLVKFMNSQGVQDNKNGFVRKGKEFHREILLGFPFRPNIDERLKRILNQHLRRSFEASIYPHSWSSMKDYVLQQSKNGPHETLETKTRADFDYFDRLEKEERLNPDLPHPFSLDFLIPLLQLCGYFVVLSIFIYSLEILSTFLFVDTLMIQKGRQSKTNKKRNRNERLQRMNKLTSRNPFVTKWRIPSERGIVIPVVRIQSTTHE
jgi:hypothetical protein